jgi:hypothetical protein
MLKVFHARTLPGRGFAKTGPRPAFFTHQTLEGPQFEAPATIVLTHCYGHIPAMVHNAID